MAEPMTDPPDLLDPLISVLAIAGVANRQLLATLTASQLTERQLRALRQHPAVTTQDEWFYLDEPFAATQRKALEQDQFLHFLHHSEMAIDLLGARLAPITPTAASLIHHHFHQLFHRVADLLLNQEPARLLALVEQVQQFPLPAHTAADSQLFAGIALRNLERYDEAEQIFAALLTTATLLPPTHARTLNARAIAAFLQGHLQRALDDYAASLTIWQQLGDAVQEGMVRLNMGVVAYECHDYALAETQLLAAERLLTRHENYTWLAAAHHELALVYRDQGRWQEALTYFEQCALRRRQEGADDRLAIALDSIGEIYLLQGRFAEALPLFEEATAKMTSRVNRVDLLLHLGLLYQLQQDYGLATTYYTAAEALIQALAQSYLLPVVYYRLGELQARIGESERALAYWRSAIQWIEENRTPLREEGLKINLLGRWQQLYAAMILLLVAEQRNDEALTYVEQARARAFLDLLQQADEPQPSADDAVDPTALTLNLAQIQAQLPPQSALIEFFATGLPGTAAALLANWPAEAAHIRDQLVPPERLLAFVVTGDTITVVELAVTLQQIAAQYFNRSDGRLRGLLPLPGQPLHPMRRWQALGRQLLAPLAEHVAGKTHLYLVPHSTLHYLPLHALVDPDDLTGQPATTVSYAPSAAILVKSLADAQPPVAPRSLLAIGVDGDGLAHAEAEATWIAERSPGATLLGKAATRNAVLTALADYQLIHFSCHGHFRRRDPMASALQLADGELTAAQLLQQVQLQATLVVLSACDTGLNQLHPGDELMGLTRAFLGCGARSLLVTLWPVHEIPTRLLMTHFYACWQQGDGKAMALRRAQSYVATLTLPALADALQSFGLSPAAATGTISQFQAMLPGSHPFAHPYYWGAFLLIGDAG